MNQTMYYSPGQARTEPTFEDLILPEKEFKMYNLADAVLILCFIFSGYTAWTAFMGGRWQRSEMIQSAERVIQSE